MTFPWYWAVRFFSFSSARDQYRYARFAQAPGARYFPVYLLPLLLLSVLAGDAIGGVIKVPFFYDVDVHVRFLVALPLLLVAELVVHQRIRLIVRQFVERGIVSPQARPKFEAIISSAMRLRNSMVIEVVLIVLVLTAGHYYWSSLVVLESATWYAAIVDGHHQYSPAGYCMPLSAFRFFSSY